MPNKTDKRSGQRIDCEVPIFIRKGHDDLLYSATIINYGKNGLYFETDRSLDIGVEIVLLINSGSEGDLPSKSYWVKILWVREPKNSTYRFGYGAWDMTANQMLEDNRMVPKPNLDSRRHTRKPYHKSIIYAEGEQRIGGLIKNMSRGGMFIEIDGQFRVGQTAHFLVQNTNKEIDLVLKCKVAHTNSLGIGVGVKKIIKSI